MSSALQIQSIAATLDVYHQQLVSLSEALGALHEASEQIRLQLEQDRAALATYTAIAPPLATSVALATTNDGDTNPELLAETLAAADLEPVSTPRDDEFRTVELQLGTIEMASLEQQAPVVVMAAPESHHETVAIQEGEPVVPDAVAHLDPAAEVAAVQIAPQGSADAPETAAPAAEPAAKAEPVVDEAAPPADSQSTIAMPTESNVVPLAPERRKRRGLLPSRRKAMAVAASLILTASAAFTLHELYGGDIRQRLVDLAACDGDMLSVERNCTLLSWLML